MGGDLSVHNSTDIEVIVTLSQVGPLHWERIPPGSTRTIGCGQVWFTVNARLWDGNGPDGWDVATPILLSTAAVTGVVSAGAGVGVAMSGASTAGGLALVGAGGTLLGASVTCAAVVGNQARKKSGKTVVEEDTDKWLAITPSQQSAEWLAKNKVLAIEPVSEAGVYADGKTIHVNYDFTSTSISDYKRMTLKLSGT